MACGAHGSFLGKAMNRWYAENTGSDGTDLRWFWRSFSFTGDDYAALFAAEVGAAESARRTNQAGGATAVKGGGSMLKGVCAFAKANALQWMNTIKNTAPPDDLTVVKLSIYKDDNGLGFRPPFDKSMNGKRLAQFYNEGERYGLLASLLTGVANELVSGGGNSESSTSSSSASSPSSSPSSSSSSSSSSLSTSHSTSSSANKYDLLLDVTSTPSSSRGPRSTFLGGRTGPGKDRRSWEFSAALWSAGDMCEELLQLSDVAVSAAGSDAFRVLVVPLEPTVTPGFHPCWAPELQRVKLYSPRLAIIIRDEVAAITDVYAAAAVALFGESTLKGICVFFLMSVISSLLIWRCER